MLSYLLLFLTAIASILQVNDLKSRPLNVRAWLIISLLVISTCVSFYVQQKNDFENRYLGNSGIIESKSDTNTVLYWNVGLKPIAIPGGFLDVTNYQILLPEQFKDILLQAWVEDGKLFVNSEVRDVDGHRIALMQRNEWSVNPNFRYDRNFDQNGVEIFDNNGRIVLQVDLLKNIVSTYGLFYNKGGATCSILSPFKWPGHNSIGAYVVIQSDAVDEYLKLAPIEPIFKYPSDQHKGERVVK